jgi:hypothetical protein
MAQVPRRGGFLREPLLHFLLLGVGLFALHGWLNDTGALSTKTIVIDRGRIDQLAAGFALLHQRPPMAEELQGLIDDAVKEEIFYREALAQGLDRDDVIVRRRLRQKLEFVSEDVDPVPEPTDAQLQAWLVAHPAQFAIAPRYAFEQVFLDPSKRGASLQADAAGMLLQLRRGPIADVAGMGDPLLIAHHIESSSAADVQAQFGASFATALRTLAPGTWQGPIASGYGVHLVRVMARDAGRAPALADVRKDVRAEWMHAQREAANARFYAGLRQQYDVRIALPEARAAGTGADTVAELRP